MEQRSAELGTELVLDNRKLILGFVLLVALCGACFIIGFMEGKRQAIQAKVEAIAPGSLVPTPSEIPSSTAAKIPGKATEAAPAKDQTVRDPLDWYKNVQRGDAEPGKPAPKTKVVPPAQTSAATVTPTRGNNPPAPEVPVPAAKVSYSVQVGAFRQLKAAEAKVSDVKAKGFECVIEPPKAPNQLYLVKVGKFVARADAVAMQRKLANAGFSCIIKPN
jgi:cell division protein FtsN